MHEEVRELARGGRYLEAGERAAELGDLHEASELYEQACAWDRAAAASLAAGEPARALLLAAVGGAETVAEQALTALRTAAATGDLVAVGTTLSQRGQHGWAARAFEAGGAAESAAKCFERAGNAVRAAQLYEAVPGGQGARAAARVLDAALRREPHQDDVRVAFGALLLRWGKPTEALRALQAVDDASPEGREALHLSRVALTLLGMPDARAEVESRLAALGEALREPLREKTAEPLPTTAQARLLGRYDVVREVSSTPTARLLECLDTLRGERVALKLFSAGGDDARGAGRDAYARFLREARVLAGLAHPNIVPLYEVVPEGPAFVLAWMPGGTLEAQAAAAPFTPQRAAAVARSVLEALGEAHRLGVVHRDVKPANILFDAAGAARLADFGVAHLGDLSVTATAGVFGTLAYMSPEQREGRPATAQSDLFGVGVVLYELLTGRRAAPFTGDADHADEEQSLRRYHRHFDARHDRAILPLLARDPARRPSDAFAAARALEEVPWPTFVDDARPNESRGEPGSRRPESVHPPQHRLVPASDEPGRARDVWLDREVERLRLTPGTLARAARFAQVSHRGLQPILRVDRDTGTLWLGVPTGKPLDRPLAPTERAIVGEALARLHAVGFVHGRIDRTQLVLAPHSPVLLFPPEENDHGTPDLDVAALARL